MIELPLNEPVLNYEPGSKEREEVSTALHQIYTSKVDVPMYVGDKKVFTTNKKTVSPPHNHQLVIGNYTYTTEKEVTLAIEAALAAKEEWSEKSLEERAKVFLRAADLLAGPYRAKLNAATMAGQSKNVYQAEIDSACELIDFLRFNAAFAQKIYNEQPISTEGVKNTLEYRPLEGFVFAVTPFNFTAIAGNLCAAPALMGNTVVWKPADTQVYAAHLIMELFLEAGLPPGVINLIYGEGPLIGEVVFKHPSFAGLHFTGSTAVFKQLWKTIGDNLSTYKTYPRIVGETGGKDFVLAHPTAKINSLVTALVRGAFEFQGQKCSAASRAYIPVSLWPEVKKGVVEQLKEIKVGPPEDFKNFINAVIDKRAYEKIKKYIEDAKNCHTCEVIAGGECNASEGYYILPTVIETKDPMYKTMVEEIFGPVLTVYVYEDDLFEDMLTLVDETSPYALTGAVFSEDTEAIDLAQSKLKNAAGNFYINDKPTGAVVGQQPFGGARGSGTNDKAGSMWNLLRWVSPRTIKQNFNPPEDYKYPFMR